MASIVDAFLLIYFIVMGFTIVCIDSQLLLPSCLFPSPLIYLKSWYLNSYDDYLVQTNPPFFKGCAIVEVFVQLPLIIAGIYSFIKGKTWFKTVSLVYGVCAATTMAPILADIYASNSASKDMLLSIYAPFLVISLVAVCRGLVKTSSVKPSHSSKTRKRA